jgi:hypothetical protein
VMCKQLCNENGLYGTHCEECGAVICCDATGDDDQVRQPFAVMSSVDVLCAPCGIRKAEARTAADQEEDLLGEEASVYVDEWEDD